MGICFSDPAVREMFLANLDKQSRLFDKDITRLGLDNKEVEQLFAAFQIMDTNGDGNITEQKWTNFFIRNVKEERANAKSTNKKETGNETVLQKAALVAAKAAADARALANKTKLGPDRDNADKLEKAATEANALVLAEEAAAAATPRRKYVRRLFHAFSRAGRGSCDFGEYLCSCIEFLVPLQWSLIHFAFTIYDTDGGGTLQIKPGSTGLPIIDHDDDDDNKNSPSPKLTLATNTASSEVNVLELLALAKEMTTFAGKKGKALTTAVQKDIMMLQSSRFVPPPIREGALVGREIRHINQEEFAAFALKYPAVLYPAVRLQQALRLRLGGEKLFKAIAARKLWATGGKIQFLTTSQLWSQQIIEDVQRAKRKGLDTVPASICILAEDVRKPEDLAPEQDVSYLQIQYIDAFGRVSDFRRGLDRTGAADPSKEGRGELRREKSRKDVENKRKMLGDISTGSRGSTSSVNSASPNSSTRQLSKGGSKRGSINKIAPSTPNAVASPKPNR